MGEDLENESYRTYATKITCIKVDWIINQNEGLIFLREMVKQKNQNIFMTEYMKILIQFLYQIYRRKIMKMLLPPYIFHMFFAFLYILTSENYRDIHLVSSGLTGDPYDDESIYSQKSFDNWYVLLNISIGVCTFMNFVNLFIFIK